LLAERGARGLREPGEQGRVEQPGGDRADPDAQLGEVARDGQRHADDAALPGRVGGLADLAVEGRHRGRVHDDAALPPPAPRSASAVAASLAVGGAARRMQLTVPIRSAWIARGKPARSAGPRRPNVLSAVPIPAQLTRAWRPP